MRGVLKIGRWVHTPVPELRPRRLLRRLADQRTKHFKATGHPIIEGYDPPEAWGWCYLDEVVFDLSDRATPQDGPIPRFV